MKELRLPAIVFVGLGLFAAFASQVSGLSYWLVFAIGAVALFLNGVIAHIEDRAQEGSGSPGDGKAPTHGRWLRRSLWIVGVGVVVATITALIKMGHA